MQPMRIAMIYTNMTVDLARIYAVFAVKFTYYWLRYEHASLMVVYYKAKLAYYLWRYYPTR